MNKARGISVIPEDVLALLERELTDLKHGTVSLTIKIHDGNQTQYVVNREISYIPGRPTSGAIKQHGAIT
jgi:hypothetical protein